MKFDVQLANSVKFTDIEPYVLDDNFYMEQKLDGVRLAIVVADNKVTGYGRRNETFVDSTIVTLLSGISDEWVLDGEMVDGVFWVFDLPRAPGIKSHFPFELRRKALETVMGVLTERCPIVRLVPCAKTRNEKLRLAQWCVDNHAEGLMIKAVNGPYTEGKRSDFSLKAKLLETVDCIVTEIGREGKRSIAVSLYDERGNLVDVGSVAVTERMLDRLQLGDCIEARYLYANNADKPRLYQPAFLRVRSDKIAAECTLDQLKFTSHQVLPSLPQQVPSNHNER